MKSNYSISSIDKREQSSTPHKWRWQPCKQTGNRPSPRSGCALASPSGATSKAYVFGGVFDKVRGVFDKVGYLLKRCVYNIGSMFIR